MLRNILLENCRVDKIQNNGFSGFLMNNITLRGLSINRIERSAFSDQSAIDHLHIDRCNIREGERTLQKCRKCFYFVDYFHVAIIVLLT